MKIFDKNKCATKKIYYNIILLIVCFISLIWLIITFKQLNKNGNLKIENSINKHKLYYSKELAVKNIQPWMTFDYINIIFRLNPSYFQKNLNISDSRYPNIRIDKYAKKYKINLISLLTDIKSLIINYRNNN